MTRAAAVVRDWWGAVALLLAVVGFLMGGCDRWPLR